jgi:hypothetical protein
MYYLESQGLYLHKRGDRDSYEWAPSEYSHTQCGVRKFDISSTIALFTKTELWSEIAATPDNINVHHHCRAKKGEFKPLKTA